MVQANLKSDNFCGYNTAAAPFYWIMDPVQVKEQYNVGEVGVPTGVGLHTPSEVIGVSNFLSDRGNYLTSCIPPVPSMLSPDGYASDASILDTSPSLEIQGMPPGQPSDRDNEHNKEEMHNLHMNTKENFKNEFNGENKPNYSNYVDKADGKKVEFNETKHERLTFLLPEITHQKGAAKDLSAVNWQAGFSGNPINLFTNPQDLTHIIERVWLERGGLDQNQVIKQSQESFTRNTHADYIKNGFRETGPVNLKGQEQISTCAKIRQPYNIKFHFGIPPIKNGVEEDEHSEHFNAIDIASLGISSPQLDQNTNLPFNYDAVYNNGGCNQVSFLNNYKMCSNENNDLTGVNSFNFSRDLPPPGLNPITIM